MRVINVNVTLGELKTKSSKGQLVLSYYVQPRREEEKREEGIPIAKNNSSLSSSKEQMRKERDFIYHLDEEIESEIMSSRFFLSLRTYRIRTLSSRIRIDRLWTAFRIKQWKVVPEIDGHRYPYRTLIYPLSTPRNIKKENITS